MTRKRNTSFKRSEKPRMSRPKGKGSRGERVKVPKKTIEERKDLSTPTNISPPVDPTQTKAGLLLEQQLARVEMVMLKGVRIPHQIKHTLDAAIDKSEYPDESLKMSLSKIKQLIERVHARWEITANGGDVKLLQGEMIHKFDLLEQKMWNQIATLGNDSRAIIVCVNTIIQINEKKCSLLGLTPDSAKNISSEDNSSSVSFSERMNKSSVLGNMAEQLMKTLKTHHEKNIKVVNPNVN